MCWDVDSMVLCAELNICAFVIPKSSTSRRYLRHNLPVWHAWKHFISYITNHPDETLYGGKGIREGDIKINKLENNVSKPMNILKLQALQY